MESSKIIHDTWFFKDVFELKLSFVEMHIIMKAMAEYARCGYNPRDTKTDNFNEAHAIVAEKLSDKLTDIFCNKLPTI